MKKKRHRVIDPRKAREAAIGGFSFHPPEECCGKCGQTPPEEDPEVCDSGRATSPLPQTDTPAPF